MRDRLTRLLVAALLAGACVVTAVAPPASADDAASCQGFTCSVEAGTKKTPDRSSTTVAQPRKGAGSVSSSTGWTPSKPGSTAAGFGFPTALSEAQAQASFAVQQLRFQRCESATQLGLGPVGGCTTPIMPTVPEQDPGQPAAPVVTITPQQAAATAVARLRLPTVKPGIGPSPNLNRWKMAAVGYPLWLWADGPTRRGPVADSAGGVNVSLDARVSNLTFQMGDGNRVSCPGHGTKWTPSVKPGTKSPTCGHTYTEPSLPASSYQVTAVANWAVTWTAGGQTGVIDVPAVTTRQLPVGELQSIITG